MFDYQKGMNYKTKFGPEIWQLILTDQVKKGMTKEACELSWGKPKDVVSTQSSDGKKLELWSYESNKLYFNEGILFEME